MRLAHWPADRCWWDRTSRHNSVNALDCTIKNGSAGKLHATYISPWFKTKKDWPEEASSQLPDSLTAVHLHPAAALAPSSGFLNIHPGLCHPGPHHLMFPLPGTCSPPVSAGLTPCHSNFSPRNLLKKAFPEHLLVSTSTQVSFPSTSLFEVLPALTSMGKACFQIQ